MKLIPKILITTGVLLIAYNIFLIVFPLKKTVFYTNEERIEEYLHGETRDIVLVGSSLSGAFEDRVLFNEKYFNLYLPHTGALTGLEVIKRSGRIPKKLFVEINHMDRGIDSQALNKMFSFPMYELRTFLPFLRSKNKTLNNLVDRVITPSGKQTNDNRPPQKLYDELISKAQKEWNNTQDSIKIINELKTTADILDFIASEGCEIVLYEMPIDSSLEQLPRALIQRNFFTKLAKEKVYFMIDNNPTETYNTGDGVHLLSKDASKYMDYFLNQLSKH